MYGNFLQFCTNLIGKFSARAAVPTETPHRMCPVSPGFYRQITPEQTSFGDSQLAHQFKHILALNLGKNCVFLWSQH